MRRPTANFESWKLSLVTGRVTHLIHVQPTDQLVRLRHDAPVQPAEDETLTKSIKRRGFP